jgi:hypothetical protein
MRADLQKALEAENPTPLTTRTKFVNSFLYGEYGVGKTILAVRCGVATGKRVLLIRTDTGTDSLFNHPDLLPHVDVVDYKGLAQLTAVAEAISERLTIGETDYFNYGAVIVDTVSQVQEEYLDWILEHFQFTGNHRTVATPRDSRIKRELGLQDEEITGLPDYHLARNKMRGPVKALIKAPCDVWFIAHLREPSFTDVAKGKLVRRPTLTETVFKLIAREVSLMGLMERTGTKREVQFKTDKKTVSKSRIKELDDQTVDADKLPQILNDWKNK